MNYERPVSSGQDRNVSLSASSLLEQLREELLQPRQHRPVLQTAGVNLTSPAPSLCVTHHPAAKPRAKHSTVTLCPELKVDQSLLV